MGSEVFHTLKKQLSADGHNTNVGDEGGFAPGLASAPAALDFIMKSIEKAGYRPGEDMYLALDCASTEFFKDGKYDLEGEGRTLEPEAMADYLAELVNKYPIISIEDGMAEDDWDGWKILTDQIGAQVPAGRRRSLRDQLGPPARRHQDGRCQLDPRQGQPDRLADRKRWMPSRPRTRRATRPSCRTARAKPRIRPSPISPSPPIADRSRPARLPAPTALAKYNQLIRIEEELGPQANYAGRSILARLICDSQIDFMKTRARKRTRVFCCLHSWSTLG